MGGGVSRGFSKTGASDVVGAGAGASGGGAPNTSGSNDFGASCPDAAPAIRSAARAVLETQCFIRNRLLHALSRVRNIDEHQHCAADDDDGEDDDKQPE